MIKCLKIRFAKINEERIPAKVLNNCEIASRMVRAIGPARKGTKKSLIAKHRAKGTSCSSSSSSGKKKPAQASRAGRGGAALRGHLVAGQQEKRRRVVTETVVTTTTRTFTETTRRVVEDKGRAEPAATVSVGRVPSTHVYVLELEKKKVYVGKTHDVEKRVGQHMEGKGASFTKRYKPTGRLLPRLGCLEGDGDGPERDETLRQMDKHGINNEIGRAHV